jgi:hypothetical protein
MVATPVRLDHPDSARADCVADFDVGRISAVADN